MNPRILFQPGDQLEMAIKEFQAEVKTVGADITRTQALRFFAELGCKEWHQQKQAKTKVAKKPSTSASSHQFT